MSEAVKSVDSGEHAEVLQYFRDKADGYDRVDEQLYWRLSDELLWEGLERYVLPVLPQGGRLLDAGGGTGRWIDRLLRARPDLTGVLFDLSPEMSRHAVDKAEYGGYADRLTVVNGDLMNVAEELDGQNFDLVISFHNVLGFVSEPTEVLSQLSSLMNVGAHMVLVLPNRYHAAFFNVMVGNLDEARSAVENRAGRFTPDMPKMHLFTPTELQGDLARVGLHTTVRTGFPVLVYPGYQETQLDGSSVGVERALSDPEHYQQIRDLELKLLGETALAERGNNLFFVAKRGI